MSVGQLRNLLVLCNTFPDKNDKYVGSIFIKEQLKKLSIYFEKIFVIAPVPFGIEYWRKTSHENYIYNNMYVLFPRYLNVPIFYFKGKPAWVYLEERIILKTLMDYSIKFDLIHAHHTWPPGRIAINIKERFKVPVVITEHTSKTFERVVKRKDPHYIKTWEQSDAIIRIRQGDINNFSKLGINDSKVYYIPNGYDETKFYPMEKNACRQKLNLPLDKQIILNVGNLYEIKGTKFLVSAMKVVLEDNKDVYCFIIGKGKLKERLENQIKQLEIQNNVKLIGSKSHEEIPIWINACDVFVLPSLGEGNPTVMFECLGCGKPFIGTKVGGEPEIICCQDYGILSEPGNFQDLAEKINIALKKNWEKKKILEYSKQFT